MGKNLSKKFRDLDGDVCNNGLHIDFAHKVGDLVKVRITNYRGETEFKYGFVVGEQEIEQLSMFPMLPVYVFDYSEIQMHYPLSLEIISS